MAQLKKTFLAEISKKNLPYFQKTCFGAIKKIYFRPINKKTYFGVIFENNILAQFLAKFSKATFSTNKKAKPRLISQLLNLITKHTELLPIQKRLSLFTEKWNSIILQHQSRHLPKNNKRKVLIHVGFISSLPKNYRSMMGHNDDVVDAIEQWS